MNALQYLLYASGQVGMMVLARFFFQWVLKFADSGGTVSSTSGDSASAAVLFSAAVVGLVFFAFRIFDGVTDPVAGVISDVWVKKGKQRRSLLWFSFFLPPIGMALVFAPSMEMSQALRWVFMGGGMFLFFVGYTFYAIPYWSLIDDYSGTSVPRRRVLSNILGAGILVATLLGFVVSPIIVQKFGFFTGALAFCIPATLLMVLPYFAQPKDYQQPVVSEKDKDQHALAGFKQAFTHRRFLAVLVILCGSQMSFTVMTAAAPYIATELLRGDLSDVAKLMGPFLLTALPFFVAVPFISKRFGWQKGIVFGSVALAVVYGGTAGLGEAIVGSPMVTAMILFSLGGPMAAILLGLEAEAITACAREKGGSVTAMYFGVFNFLVKGFNGLALFLTGQLSDMSKDPEYGTGAVRAMGLMAGSLLVIGCVGYFLIRPRGKDPAVDVKDAQEPPEEPGTNP